MVRDVVPNRYESIQLVIRSSGQTSAYPVLLKVTDKSRRYNSALELELELTVSSIEIEELNVFRIQISSLPPNATDIGSLCPPANVSRALAKAMSLSYASPSPSL